MHLANGGTVTSSQEVPGSSVVDAAATTEPAATMVKGRRIVIEEYSDESDEEEVEKNVSEAKEDPVPAANSQSTPGKSLTPEIPSDLPIIYDEMLAHTSYTPRTHKYTHTHTQIHSHTQIHTYTYMLAVSLCYLLNSIL